MLLREGSKFSFTGHTQCPESYYQSAENPVRISLLNRWELVRRTGLSALQITEAIGWPQI
jgi:hypothetical protein